MSYVIGAVQLDFATRLNAMAVPLFAPLASGLDRVPNLPSGFKQKFKTRPIDALLDLTRPLEDVIYEVNDAIVTKINGGEIPVLNIDLRSVQPGDNNLDESNRDFAKRVRGTLIFMTCMVFVHPAVFYAIVNAVLARHAMAAASNWRPPVPPPLPNPLNLPPPDLRPRWPNGSLMGFSIGAIDPGTATVAVALIGGAATVSAAALPPATLLVSKAISDQSRGAPISAPSADKTVVTIIKEMSTGEKVAAGVGILSVVGITAYLVRRK